MVYTIKKTVIFNIATNTVDKDLKDALPGLHALTGCDSTSCFSGQGKLNSLKLLKKMKDLFMHQSF